jgi:protein phosphatase
MDFVSYRILYACISHPGKVRQINQDNFICNGQYMPIENGEITLPLHGSCISTDNPVFGIFDGMGGEQCGEVAAHIAAQYASTLAVGRDGIDALDTFCRNANQAICEFSAENGVSSTGTTAAMLLFTKKKICLCNIGDSKVFRFRDGELTQLSTDHLCLAPFGVKPPLSQNLGISPEEMRIDPYFLKIGYTIADTYLICSDGLTDMVTNEEIKEILSSAPINTAIEQLLNRALEKGGKDNTTIILCRIEKEPQWLFLRKTKEKREE